MDSLLAGFCFGIVFSMVVLFMTAGLCWAASRGDDYAEGHDDFPS